eukprot:4574152-Prymnesium_polylepis.1
MAPSMRGCREWMLPSLEVIERALALTWFHPICTKRAKGGASGWPALAPPTASRSAAWAGCEASSATASTFLAALGKRPS